MRIRATALAVIAAATLSLLPATAAMAVLPPGTIAAAQDMSEPCGDTTGADIVVTVTGGAANVLYSATIPGVATGQATTNTAGNATIMLNNVGLNDVGVQVSAAGYSQGWSLLVDVQCGFGSGKE